MPAGMKWSGEGGILALIRTTVRTLVKHKATEKIAVYFFQELGGYAE